VEKNKNYLELKKFSLEMGAALFGVADISSCKDQFLLPPEITAGMDKAICLGVRLSKSVMDDVKAQPTLLYFRNYRSANNLLDQLGLQVSNRLEEAGYLSLAIPASQVVDWKKQIGHISHKKIGYLAGLGWLGRNNLLVNSQLGSRFRLVTILTNMPLTLDQPVNQDCGECRQCIARCPAQAIKESQKDFDYLKCLEQCKDFHRQRLAEQFICGVCVSACAGRGK